MLIVTLEMLLLVEVLHLQQFQIIFTDMEESMPVAPLPLPLVDFKIFIGLL